MKLKTYLRKIRWVCNLYETTRLYKKYLSVNGWLESRYLRMPVDKDLNPLPWYTYSAIHFLEPRIRKEFRVFEFGSGNSTLWYSKRVSSVICVEQSLEYYEYLKPKFQKNSNITCVHEPREEEGGYADVIYKYPEKFDVIVIDGSDRVRCAYNAPKFLKPDGVVVFDNSNREMFDEGLQYLLDSGFRRINFWGHGPISHIEWCTSVFYRTDNCLGI